MTTQGQLGVHIVVSDLAKKLFEGNKEKILFGAASISQYLKELGDHEDDYLAQLDDSGNAYYLILDPDHPNYEDQLTQMECSYEGISIPGVDTHAGFIEPEGEVSRIVVFPGEIIGGFGQEASQSDASFLKRILPDILFDFHQINDTAGIR